MATTRLPDAAQEEIGALPIEASGVYVAQAYDGAVQIASNDEMDGFFVGSTRCVSFAVGNVVVWGTNL